MSYKRKRLAELLTEATGHSYSADKIYPAKGWERSGGGDFFRWTASPNSLGAWTIDSYDTITDCVRYGITVNSEYHEAYAKKPCPS